MTQIPSLRVLERTQIMGVLDSIMGVLDSGFQILGVLDVLDPVWVSWILRVSWIRREIAMVCSRVGK